MCGCMHMVGREACWAVRYQLPVTTSQSRTPPCDVRDKRCQNLHAPCLPAGHSAPSVGTHKAAGLSELACCVRSPAVKQHTHPQWNTGAGQQVTSKAWRSRGEAGKR